MTFAQEEIQVRVGASLASALAAFLASDWVFRRGLIWYWEWQHGGRQMKYTLWADEGALLLAFLTATITFFWMMRYLTRKRT